MADPMLATRSLRKAFGGIVATDNLSLEVAAGEIHAVIGPNGAGKTTLVDLLSGQLKADGGEIVFNGRRISRLKPSARSHRGLARSFQITSIFPDFTVLDNVALAVQAQSGHSFRFWRPAAGDARLYKPAGDMLARVGLEGRGGVLAGNLAHGEQRQLEIAMALATRPKMLLLDEPMAGMGIEESQSMIALLGELKSDYTMLLVEHDMDAVFALADRITVLVYGRSIATGTPADIRANADVRDAYLGTSEGE
ncbi:MAG: ABC transporter ATP-binding protein [Alphaproteobacteria bacterium]|nr:ABC transporter ATP-binding protein [Alphaproteobacteria bacterium]